MSAISPACPPLTGVMLGGVGRSDKCQRYNAAVLEYIAQARPRISTVLIVARWPFYAEGTRMPFESGHGVILGGGDLNDAPRVLQEQLTATLRNLLKNVDNVVLLAPFPEFDRPVAVNLARAHAWGFAPLDRKLRSAVTRRQASSLEALKNAMKIDPQRIAVVSPLTYFCDTEACDFADADGRPLFTDTNHLNALGVDRVGPLLEKLLAAPGETADLGPSGWQVQGQEAALLRQAVEGN